MPKENEQIGKLPSKAKVNFEKDYFDKAKKFYIPKSYMRKQSGNQINTSEEEIQDEDENNLSQEKESQELENNQIFDEEEYEQPLVKMSILLILKMEKNNSINPFDDKILEAYFRQLLTSSKLQFNIRRTLDYAIKLFGPI